MSYCISINNLENLPNESTLLIHYSILCTGTWYLSQLNTAYRNVCDTEWTVMYPNHQHPRHTDFPITVTNPSFPGTFAWNYGGIQGISSENFDEYHSYITQLAIFNYDCYNTGQPIIIEPTGQPEVTGEPTGYPGEEPESPGGGGGPTGPGGPGSPGVPGGPGSPGSPGSNIPSAGVKPGQGLPGGGTPNNPGGQPGSEPGIPPYIPSQEPPFGQPSLPQPGGSIPEPPQGGGRIDNPGIGPVRDVRNLDNRTREGITRTSDASVGSILNPNLIFQSSSRNPAIPSIPGSVGIQVNNSIDINTINITEQGSILGGLSNNLHTNRPAGTGPSSQVSLPVNNYNNYIDIGLSSNEVVIGEPIVISCLMSSPSSITAKMEVYIQDSVSSLLVGGTDYIDLNSSTPLTCGISTFSNYFNVGPLVITCKIISNNTLIGIKSVLMTILESIDGTLSSQSSTNTSLPTNIINHAGVSTGAINIHIPDGQTINVILSSEQSIDRFSAILNTSYNSQDNYSITVYNATTGGTASGSFSETFLSGNVIYLPEAGYSDSRYTISDSQVYIDRNTVGISRDITPTKLVLVEIAPAQGNAPGSTEGELYVSEGTELRPITVTITSTTVTAQVPYGNMEIGLLIHGYENGLVDSMYTAVSNAFGAVVWTASIIPDYWYSIVIPTNGELNPFSTPIYNDRYIQ